VTLSGRRDMTLKTKISVDLHWLGRRRLMSAFSHSVAVLTRNSWPACPDSGLTRNSSSLLWFTADPGTDLSHYWAATGMPPRRGRHRSAGPSPRGSSLATLAERPKQLLGIFRRTELGWQRFWLLKCQTQS
jgi:hypothetical protein